MYKKGFLFLLLVLFSTTLHAATSVTASHYVGSPMAGYFNAGAGMGTDGIVYDNREAQTFTATTGGVLDTISCVVRRMNKTTADLKITLTDVVSGQPGVSLATAFVNLQSVPIENWSWWDRHFTVNINFISQDVVLEAGKQYAIVLSTDTTEANYRVYGDYTGYSGGTRMSSQNSGSYMSEYPSDLYFEVTVNSIPEPSTVLLIAAGAAFLKRRRTKLDGETVRGNK